MSMKRRVGMNGFTIVETMIVLAVTGALFIAVAASMAGRQRSNEFIQSINDVRTRIQQVITETQKGYYANLDDFWCQQSGSTVIFSSGGPSQGENQDCVFLGKVMQFAGSGVDVDKVRVYPVAGLRVPSDPTNLATADPSVINNGSTVDESTTFPLKFGLTVVAMKSGATSAGAFGILSSADSSNPGQSGDQQFDVYGLTGVPLNPSSKILDGPGALALDKNPSGGVKICFKSGSTDQYGMITVGNNSSQLSVELQITKNVNCTGLM